MITKSRVAFTFYVAWLSLVAPPALGVEPTAEIRTAARMFADLDARDQKGFCESRLGTPYLDYLNRVCQSAVQNKLKAPEDCSREKISEQVKSDAAQCLAMTTAEFEATVLRGVGGRNTFVAEMRAQGVDGDKLVQDECARRR